MATSRSISASSTSVTIGVPRRPEGSTALDQAGAADRERQPAGVEASMATPSARSASTIGRIGRLRACGSPSNSTVPSASAATGGRNRMIVPARPTSTRAGPRSGPG